MAHSDGRRYPAGFFGGGLVDAVTGNPVAVEYARSARTKSIWGLVTLLPATACLGATYGEYVGRVRDERATGFDGTELAVLGGCFAVAVVSTLLYSSSLADRTDAVNVFNDSPGTP